MADFLTALRITLAFEGGYVNNPKDPGGETNHGITMAVFQHTAHPLLHIDPTSANLKALTAAQAAVIYRANYWNPIHGDAIPSQPLANILFDFYVNAGTHASKLLQTVINTLGATPPIPADGTIGPATIAALATLPADAVFEAYKQGRIAYYQSLAKKYPVFLKGWLARANAFPSPFADPLTESASQTVSS